MLTVKTQDAANPLMDLLKQHLEAGRYVEAEEMLNQVLPFAPNHPGILRMLSFALMMQNKFTAALEIQRQIFRLDPDKFACNGLGRALEQVGQHDEAQKYFRMALTIDPSFCSAHYRLGVNLLFRGDFANGGQHLEMRGIAQAFRFGPPGQPKADPNPVWAGQDLNNEPVAITHEGGFGDAMIFCRYAPLVAERGGRVVFIAPPELQRLLRNVPGISEVVGSRDDIQGRRHNVLAASLPHVCGTARPGDIPWNGPYFRGDPAPWAEFLAGLSGLKVGICWAGMFRPDFSVAAVDRRRSMRLIDMLPLLDAPDCSFISLQLGPPAAQMASLPQDVALHDVSDRLHDWQHTADLIMGLDLVITVDTAVVHLAGGLGKDVFLLNHYDACWRWFRDRTDSPWYPGVKIFRQQHHSDWRLPVADVARDLARLASQKSNRF